MVVAVAVAVTVVRVVVVVVAVVVVTQKYSGRRLLHFSMFQVLFDHTC